MIFYDIPRTRRKYLQDYMIAEDEQAANLAGRVEALGAYLNATAAYAIDKYIIADMLGLDIDPEPEKEKAK